MAANLRKYKYTGTSVARPNTSSEHSAAKSPDKATPPSPKSDKMDISGLKSEIILSLKTDIAAVIKSELKGALTEDFDFLKNELKAVKTEIMSNTAALRSELAQVKASVTEVEGGLSAWSDEVTTLQNTVSELRAEMEGLKKNYDDMEGRMRRCNIRIHGVPETPDSSSPASVSKLLTEILQLDKEPLVDRSHRGLGPKKPGGKPRVIVVKLHYYQDCVEILRRARTKGPLRFHGDPVAIFPDYTMTVARARAAFTEVKRLLRGQEGVRYGLLFPARLRLTFRGEDKEFTDPDKAMDYVRKNIVSATMEADQ